MELIQVADAVAREKDIDQEIEHQENDDDFVPELPPIEPPKD